MAVGEIAEIQREFGDGSVTPWSGKTGCSAHRFNRRSRPSGMSQANGTKSIADVMRVFRRRGNFSRLTVTFCCRERFSFFVVNYIFDDGNVQI